MKRKFAAFLAAVILAGILGGCAAGERRQEDGFRLWFAAALVDENGWTGASQAVNSVAYTGEENVVGVLRALLAGPQEGSGLRSPFPEGTELVGWKRNGSIVQVDLSQEYSQLTGMEQTVADYCIVLTLVQLEGVDGVRIAAEGSAQSRRILRREDVVFSGVEEEPVEVTAMLCYRRAGSAEPGIELHTFRLTENESAPLAVLEALLAGPTDSSLERLIPAGVEAYSARVDDGVCYADFSSALTENLPATAAEQELVIRSIVESLCSLSSVQSVQILVEGELLTSYGAVELIPEEK